MDRQHIWKEEIQELAAEKYRVRSNHRRVASFMKSVDAVVARRFDAGRKLRGSDFMAIRRECADILRNEVSPLRSVSCDVAATRVHPKGEAFETRFHAFRRMDERVPGLSCDDLYQLFSFRIKATRKQVTVDYRDHPVAFRYHAAERLVERTGGMELALRHMANTTAGWLLFICSSEKHSRTHTDGRLTLPYRDGLGAVLGNYFDYDGGMRYGTRYDGCGNVEYTFSDSMPGRIFVIGTFVDRAKLRPVQSYAMNLMDMWRMETGQAYEDLNQRYLWTYGSGMADNGGDDLPEKATELLGAMFENEPFQRGLRRTDAIDGVITGDERLPMGTWRNSRSFRPPVPPRTMTWRSADERTFQSAGSAFPGP